MWGSLDSFFMAQSSQSELQCSLDAGAVMSLNRHYSEDYRNYQLIDFFLNPKTSFPAECMSKI
jgi:hypothetical protein